MDTLTQALSTLATSGERLRTVYRFDWTKAIEQTVHRLRLADPPPMVALTGGASSGKSTLFNNLLGGRPISCITARGHTTLGPILAIHERQRERLEALQKKNLFMPGFLATTQNLNAPATGAPDSLVVVIHREDALADVWLFDLPDFTSESAKREGDVAMTLLPWFDALLVVVDHERWFDRQAVSDLHAASQASGQKRFVLFNRTREGELSPDDRAALEQQAKRLDSAGMSVLEFRRGRGLVQFAPGMLDGVHDFLGQEPPRRHRVLAGRLTEAAGRVLNLNEERRARFGELREGLDRCAERTLPDVRSCMWSLMTGEERRQVEPWSRILRLRETKAWLVSQTRRLWESLGDLPVLGSVMRNRAAADESPLDGANDRPEIARAYYESVARRQWHELQRTVQSSAFWDELRRWTGLEPVAKEFHWTDDARERIDQCAAQFDEAVKAWTARVEAECRGLAPHMKGAAGFAGIALAAALIAVPGSVGALTLLSAAGAVSGGFGSLLAAAGTGALLAKPMGRMLTLVEEKLLGSKEFTAVHAAAAAFRLLLETQSRTACAEALAEAGAFVLPEADPLHGALETLREPSGESV